MAKKHNRKSKAFKTQAKKQVNKKSTLSIATAATIVGLSGQTLAAPCLDITVTSAAANGPGSLSDAFIQANNAGSCDDDFHTITLSSGLETIVLESPLEATAPIEIVGNGPANVGVTASSPESGQQFNTNGADLKLSGFNISGMNVSPIEADGANVILVDMEIMNNSSSSSGGGVLVNGGSLDIQNSVLTGNDSGFRGGAISATYSEVTISDSRIDDNTSQSEGGGIFSDESNLTISGSSISGNTAMDNDGGGVYFESQNNTVKLELNASSLTSNNARDGAGLYIELYDSSDSQVLINNTTISSNTAMDEGGGIHMNSANLDINASTIVQNSAANGGGMLTTRKTPTISLDHTILAQNTASVLGANGLSEDPDTLTFTDDLEIASATYSLVGDATNTSILSQENSQIGIDDASLGLMSLAENGGIGLSHLPTDDRLVDSGGITSEFDTDQAGNPRLVGGQSDIGSLEVQPVPESPTPVPKQPTNDDGLFGGLFGSISYYFMTLLSLVLLARSKK